MKQTFSAKSDADFVVVSDTDELVFPQNFAPILEECRSRGITVPLTTGYHMLAESFDFDSGDIYQINRAYREPLFDKKIVFCPKIKITWSPGQHSTIPQLCGNGYLESVTPMLEVRHFKYIDFKYVMERNGIVGKRLNDNEVKMGLGIHHLFPDETQKNYKTHMLNESIYL